MKEDGEKTYIISLGILFLLSFTLAAHVLTPSTYENGLGFSFNETSTTNVYNVYNITVNNTEIGAIANITQVNITIPSTFTFIPLSQGQGENETVAIFTNTTTILSWTNATADWFLINGTEAGVAGNWTYFWFNASATTPGTYNITITTVNGTGTLEQNISVEINDTTAPSPTFTGLSPAANANLSQNYILVNISGGDTDGAYAGALGTIAYFISNSSGPWNNTNTTTDFNLINFTGLVDGVYYINATANDTLGNTNNTGIETRTVTLDTTAPAITHACTPEPVTQGNTLTCTCTITDATSGVSTSSYTANPTTADTGGYTTTCTATDYAGNSATSTVTYNVAGASNTDSPGGGSTTPTWTTHTISNEIFQQGYTNSLSTNNRIKVNINEQDHYIGIKEIGTTATIEVSSTPQQATLSIGDERKFEVTDDNFYDISVKLNSITNNKADITITSIHEEITAETIVEEENKEATAQTTKTEEDEADSTALTISIIAIIIAIIIAAAIFLKKKK